MAPTAGHAAAPGHEARLCSFCSLPSREPAVVANPTAVAVPSVGSLLEGWLLVVPRHHVTALAEIELQGERDAFVKLVHEADTLLRDAYDKPTVWFEHGPAESGKSAGCGVDHAHLHIVPTDLPLKRRASESEIGTELIWRQVESMWDARDSHVAGMDYLYLREADGSTWLASHSNIPGQLFRRIIARDIGEHDWDWKSSPRLAIMERTYARLKA